MVLDTCGSDEGTGRGEARRGAVAGGGEQALRGGQASAPGAAAAAPLPRLPPAVGRMLSHRGRQAGAQPPRRERRCKREGCAAGRPSPPAAAPGLLLACRRQRRHLGTAGPWLGRQGLLGLGQNARVGRGAGCTPPRCPGLSGWRWRPAARDRAAVQGLRVLLGGGQSADRFPQAPGPPSPPPCRSWLPLLLPPTSSPPRSKRSRRAGAPVVQGLSARWCRLCRCVSKGVDGWMGAERLPDAIRASC